MKNTGFYLNDNDIYSVIATGKIDFGPKAGPGFLHHNVRPELGWPLMLRIGEGHRFSPFFGRNGITSRNYRSGDLYVGYKSGPADADKDGLVSVDEAYRYVTAHMPRATGQEQHPVKKGMVEGR